MFGESLGIEFDRIHPQLVGMVSMKRLWVDEDRYPYARLLKLLYQRGKRLAVFFKIPAMIRSQLGRIIRDKGSLGRFDLEEQVHKPGIQGIAFDIELGA
jgi:hypothetical protein